MRCFFSKGLSKTFFSKVPTLVDAFEITKILRSPSKSLLFRTGSPSYSKMIDISRPEAQIFQDFDTSTRKRIRRAERANLHISFNVDFADILMLWKKMVQEKKLPFDRNMAEDFPRSMQVSTAVYDENNTMLVGHNYFINYAHNIVFCQTSASVFRYDSLDHKNLVSNANRLLRWEDIKYFKKKGFRFFDFGGYCIDPNDKQKLSINRFKDSFMEKDTPVICYYELTSYPYILADWILKTFRREKNEE